VDRERESPNDTVVAGPSDDPIIDENGLAFRLERGDRVTIDGMATSDAPLATELVYISRVVWARDPLGRWWPRKHTGQWGPPTNDSPLMRDKLDKILQQLAEITKMLAMLLQRTQGRIVLDLQDATSRPQPVPKNPGP